MAAINLPIVAKFDKKGVDEAKAGLSGLGESAKKMGMASKLAIAGAVAGVAAFGISALKAASDAQQVANGLQQMAKNSGMFGSKAADIKAGTDAMMKQSAELAKLTGIDDEAFSSLKRNWMSVPALAATGASGLNNLAKVAADVSVGTGKDLEAVGTMFAKAFASPETAIAKLQKGGIVFTKTQQDMYNSLVASGDAAKAQGYLIDQLGSKYAGTAEAAASPFERLKYIFEDLQETVGAALMPAFSKLVDVLGPLFEKIGPLLATAFGALTPIFDVLGPVIDAVISAFTMLSPVLTQLFSFIGSTVMAVIPVFTSLMNLLMPVITQLIPPIISLLDAALKPLIDVVLIVIDSFKPLMELVLPMISQLISALSPVLGSLISAIAPLIGSVLKIAQAFFPIIEQIFPIIIQLISEIAPLIIDLAVNVIMPLVDVVMALLDAFMPLIMQILPIFVDIIKLVFAILKPFLPIIGFLANLIGTILVGAINILMPVFDALGKVIGFLYDTFIKPLIDGLTQAFDWFTKLLGLDGKKVSVQGTVVRTNNDGSPDHDNNPATKMATGGIVMPRPGGLFANIAEAGKPEAVIPLDRLDSMIGGGGQGANITISVNAGLGANGAQIGAEIVSAIKKYERASGPVFAKA